jgi:hypothetical protein
MPPFLSLFIEQQRNEGTKFCRTRLVPAPVVFAFVVFRLRLRGTGVNEN